MKSLLSFLPVRLQVRAREIMLFVLVGLLNTTIDFAVLNVLIFLTHHDSGIWLIGFTCCGFLAAVINSYILNGCLTFRGQTSRSLQRFLRFIAVNAVGLVINSSIVWSLVQISGHRFPLLATINASKGLAVVCSLVWNYIATKRWVFNDVSAPAGSPQLKDNRIATSPRVRLLSDELASLAGGNTQNDALFLWKDRNTGGNDPWQQNEQRAVLHRVTLLPINSDTKTEKLL